MSTEVTIEPESAQKKKFPLFAVILVITAIAAGSAAFYFYLQLSKLRSAQSVNSQTEVQTLVEEVGKLIVLPQDEQPTVATVADPERLKGQPFFTNAKKGDKVLIYTNARKAILYDPVAKKIVELAPLNIGTMTGAPTTSP
ncbi:MAG: hypothetical protein HY396_02720 [Candidatus Doudnabacteria bacterium]|nr:hypothetical protein [Candidatus Doudnabacteria bacterium]